MLTKKKCAAPGLPAQQKFAGDGEGENKDPRPHGISGKISGVRRGGEIGGLFQLLPGREGRPHYTVESISRELLLLMR